MASNRLAFLLLTIAMPLGIAAHSPTASAAEAARSTFGVMPDGRAVDAITLSNQHGVRIRVISLGAALQSCVTPDGNGKLADIVLGYGDLKGYLSDSSYFGATVGRFANRIAKGHFSLDGQSFQTPINNGANSLHGGTRGFGQVLWTVEGINSGPKASATLRYLSPDGDQGYPGAMTVTATYSLNDQNELSIDYRAATSRPTIANISNHAYWNLSGEGTSGGVMDQLLTLHADAFTPVDSTQIPTGEIRPVAGTAFDFRSPKAIGRDVRDGGEPQLLIGHGYDHNWVISRKAATAARLVARVEDPKSGRVLELLSAQPGLQFYSGNFLDGTVVGKSGHIYRQGDGLVLEPQIFPDTPNQPIFGSARLDPGQTYENLIIYRFSAAPVPVRP